MTLQGTKREKKELKLPLADLGFCREQNFRLVCKELENLDKFLQSLTPFKLDSFYVKGQMTFGMQNFTIVYYTSTKFSVEAEIIKVMESWPLGVNMVVEDLDNDGNTVQKWNIKKATIQTLEFGNMTKNSSMFKTMKVTFKAESLALETMELEK